MRFSAVNIARRDTQLQYQGDQLTSSFIDELWQRLQGEATVLPIGDWQEIDLGSGYPVQVLVSVSQDYALVSQRVSKPLHRAQVTVYSSQGEIEFFADEPPDYLMGSDGDNYLVTMRNEAGLDELLVLFHCSAV